jgi:hypothetical protein
MTTIWTAPRTARLKTLYEAGRPVSDIAEQCGVSEERVQRLVDAWVHAGILERCVRQRGASKPLSSGEARLHRYAGGLWTPERVDRLVALYTEGKRTAQIAPLMGLRGDQIDARLARLVREGRIVRGHSW